MAYRKRISTQRSSQAPISYHVDDAARHAARHGARRDATNLLVEQPRELGKPRGVRQVTSLYCVDDYSPLALESHNSIVLPNDSSLAMLVRRGE